MFDVDDCALNEHDGHPDPEEDTFDPTTAEEELATLSAHLDAATYRQLVLIRRLDDCGHWAAAGATTCAAWLSFRIGMDLGAARERLRVAHALRDLRKISEAMRRGTISYSKVRAITRVANPAIEERLLEYAKYTTAAQLERICRGIRQAQLLADEEGEPLDEAELLVRAFAARDVTRRSRGDGTVQVIVTLLPDEAERVVTAIEAMRDAMREESPALPPSYADAFVRLIDVGYTDATVAVAHTSVVSAADVSEVGDVSAEASSDVSEKRQFDGYEAGDVSAERANVSAPVPSDAFAEGDVPSHVSAGSDVSAEGTCDLKTRARVSAEGATARLHSFASSHEHSPEMPEPRRKKVCGGATQRVVIHLAPHLLSDDLVANLDDGTWIAPETWRRVACDCALELVKVDELGAVLDVGRKTRTIPPALARALDVRDAGRCRFPGCTHRRFLDRHHVKHWSNDGETKLDNLLTLCTAHHQLVHEGGWTVELDGDEARFFRPDGRELAWPCAPRVDDVIAELEEAHAELAIGPTTGLTLWSGKTPEYSSCVAAVF